MNKSIVLLKGTATVLMITKSSTNIRNRNDVQSELL